MFSGLSYKNPGEIHDYPKSVRNLREKSKPRGPLGEFVRISNYLKIDRSNRPEMFCKKLFLEISENLQENICPVPESLF